ncbi:MAG TPA: DUF4082 domain-containing protein [Tepidisphaeraceae bacterium]|nr:DUF4082 domain-containing protein [Tepidisphaeraceae bacterium]
MTHACIEALESRRLLAGISIAAENQLAGSPASEWDVNGSGDPTIQGFATDISVNQGQTVTFKIDDQARALYHLDIYRMGYYGGMGARKVTTIGPLRTDPQPAPMTDAATGLVDCGNWRPSVSWDVPADATSGIYFAKVVREDTGGASHIYFVVRNDTDHSDVLFKTSDTTWQAYNDWGGRFIEAPSNRAYKASYNRPFQTRARDDGYGSWNFVFHAEYPMVRWLESNGYDVSYFTSVDADRYGSMIKDHEVLLSVGHDEYWSGAQRDSVEAARDAGVDLAFFSGNECYRKIRWETSIDGSGTPYRTVVCYKETNENAPIDPADPPIWTGTWRDPRFSPPADGGRPENALSGQLFTVCVGANELGTSFKVPGEYSNLRFWRNTSVASLGLSQTATLGDHVLGYEWDEDVDNGFRPAGLINMSSTTTAVQGRLVGDNIAIGADIYPPGTATHRLTLYRAASGALVFGAGTVQWSWGLDGVHDNGSYAPDRNMQQATVNLLADMGVQPARLQAGLVAASASTDFTRPVSVIKSPGTGTVFQPGQVITITGTASDGGGGVVGGVEISVDGGLSWHPVTGRANWSYSWTPNQSGTVNIKARAADDSGNLETPTSGITITIAGESSSDNSIWSNTAVPRVVADPDSSPVELGVKFRSDVAGYVQGIRFYKGSQNSGVHIGNLWTRTGTLLARATFYGETSSGWQTVLFDTPVAIADNTTYVASYFTSSGHYSVDEGYFAVSGFDNGSLHALRSGADGLNGVYRYGSSSAFPTDSYQSSNYWVDVVFESGTDTQGPSVVGQSPSPGASGVPITTTVTATFSEPVQSSSISFTLRDASNNVVPATVSYNSTTKTATLTPSVALAGLNSYTATLSGATDLAGNSMTGPVSWSFTTVAVDNQPPSVTDRTPSPSATDVPVSTTVAATFNEAVQPSTVVFTLVGPGNVIIPASVSYNSSTRVATLTPNAALSSLTQYTATISGAKDLAGNVLASAVSWSFITVAVDSQPPSVIDHTPASGVTDVPITTTVTATFSEPVQSNSISFTLRDASNNVVPATVSYNSTTKTATLTPNVVLAGLGSYTATLSGATDLAGNGMTGPVSWSFATAAVPVQSTFSLWSDTAIPEIKADVDSAAVELGVKFRASVAGYISGIRFYKGTGNTGIHTGSLWNAFGVRLATVTFANETAGGWQWASFASPVFINANTTYVASYHTNTGHYAVNEGYFAEAGVDGGPLHALAEGEAGPNGVYRYGSTSGYPVNSYRSSNYWVDVVFSPASADTERPAVIGESPADGATSVPVATTIAAMFSEAVQASSISFVLRGADGNSVPATLAYADATKTATLTPVASLAGDAVYTAVVNGALDLAGNSLAGPVTWSFTTAGVWSETGAGEFGAGSGSSVLVTNKAGGELQLMPTVGDEFDGSELGSAWNNTTWSSGSGVATAAESNGILSLGRMQMLSVQTMSGTAIEGRIAFANGRGLQFGLATGLLSTAGNYSAVFTTKSTTTTLYARVNQAGTLRDVSLGAIPLGFHIYRVQPIATGFQFYIDGVLRTTITRTVPVGTQLKAALAAQNGLPVLQADWVRAISYPGQGSFISAVFDAGRSVTWQSGSWTADVPAGTSLRVEISSGDSADPEDGTWSAWNAVESGLPIAGQVGRYVRYRLQLTTSDSTKTPTVFDISFSWA